MAEEQVPTYFPGDVIELKIEIKHQPNFRSVVAEFVGRRISDDEQSIHVQINVGAPTVRETMPDGTKRSTLYMTRTASRNDWVPGLVYELVGLQGETVGSLPGESKKGSRVEFALSDFNRPRFRFEDEIGTDPSTVTGASLL
jgi:hypothetical protein